MTYGGVAVKNISAASELSLCCSRPSNDGGDSVLIAAVMSAASSKNFAHSRLAQSWIVRSRLLYHMGLLFLFGRWVDRESFGVLQPEKTNMIEVVGAKAGD